MAISDRVAQARLTMPFVAAVVQDCPVVFDRDRTLDKIGALTTHAAKTGARLVVFPEAFVSSYPKGLDFGARVGGRTTKGRQYFQRYYDSAVDIPGPGIDRLAEIPGDNDIYLVVGVIERERGTLYCTAVFLTPEGKYLGQASEADADGDGAHHLGSSVTARHFRSTTRPLGRLGAVIRWENYMPLLRTAMYGKGIQLYCAPTADDQDNWHASMIHVALEGRCFVLSC